MLAGISTACFYPQYTEDSIRLLSKYNPQCIEIFINAAMELDPDYLKELRTIADASGMRILSIHPYTSGMEPMYFFSGYDRKFLEGLDVYRHFFQAANLLGAEIVVFHGALNSANIPYSLYFTRLNKVWEEAKKHNVELCQENVQRCTSHTINFFTELAHELPQIRYVLDVKQAVRSNVDVYDLAEEMGTRIAHIHISDHKHGNDCLTPGKGIFNIEKLLRIIAKNRFNGGIVVELYRENFDSIVEIMGGYQHLLTAISTIL